MGNINSEQDKILDVWGEEYIDICDPLINDICLYCESYAGKEHDYRECQSFCPVLKLYAEFMKERIYSDGEW